MIANFGKVRARTVEGQLSLTKSLLPALFFASSSAWAAPQAPHDDPIAAVALWLAVILVTAKLGGDLAVRAGQPAVLGELIGGIVLGNLSLAGVSAFVGIQTDPSLEMLARIGALILLFEVGLESTVAEMLGVGISAMLVATAGVVAPFALGWGVGAWLLPEHSSYVHAFLGATLTATSVGITARVLKDLGRSQSSEARIILGAAVIDDVLGLVVLAAVSGIVVAADTGGNLSYGAITAILGKAIAFLAGSLVLGVYLSPKIFRLAAALRSGGVLLAVGLSSCFLLAWLANAIGLASIVGAFAAGLILEALHSAIFVERGEPGLPELVHPISGFLVPVFFVVMGARADLRAFTEPTIVGLATALTIAAIAGKQACSAAVIGRGIDRLSIGIGMVPRGEVGLIFANMGLALSVHGERIIDASTYSALVVMIVVTTVITPPALKWSLARAR
jgi:Kef-type K+ transport system membrane component KefB